MPPVSIRMERLTKVFGNTRAVDGIDLVIEPGELFFMLGPSGCGKTTLLRCVAGFAEPDEGKLFIGNRDVTHLPPHQRDTGMVFQSYALWPHMSVRQNVGFGLEMRGVTKEDIRKRADAALEMVKMSDRADHKPSQLSGGQQQRVALARALVIRPQCLLLDEPLSNLDAKLRLEMRSEIRRICKEAELTAIYVTHDQKEALSIADRLVVLNNGKIQQMGSPMQVYARPNSRFVSNFIGETNFLEGTVTSMVSNQTWIKTPVGTVVSRVPCPDPLAVGQTVTISLRPETLRFDDPPSGAMNTFACIVHNTVYLGEVAQHQVNLSTIAAPDVGSHVQLKAFELNPKIVARDDARQQARVWFSPDDVIVLAR